MTSTSLPIDATARTEPALPLGGLLALAMAAFITVLTEALPAGLLPRMSVDLGVSESLAGQLVTLYALGTLLTAIPLTAATQGWRRRPLLIGAILGFAVVNTVTAVSSSFAVTLAARFLAGVFAGLLWALVASYAARMVSERQKGRAMAIAMVGIPLALSLGIPAGTFLGAAVGWRVTFGIMSGLTLVLVGWVLARVPDFPGQPEDQRLSLTRVFLMPGIRPVLFVTLAFVLAHNVLYTYIAPFLGTVGLAGDIDVVLLVFGVAALASIWGVGVLIDRWLRELVLLSTALFIGVAVVLALSSGLSAVVHVSVAVWGLAYGGVATLFQTASAKTAGEASDVAQSMVVTVWNIAIAGGGLAGGVLLDTLGTRSFPWMLVLLLVPTLLVAWRAREHGFPPVPRR
ncbi:Predicted arabinose efflux permease, MFS family [Myxococcus fulvus]|uniref:Predicted arabinose efflux permease, MFS family n=2 Tax=Myxococcus fulvus TaxID=33 RepID=A0ABY1CNJ3_MYXFU|nr:MFS transporter [Myxococcus fulvus]SEU25300.1 Predicted arabinose efflux permease, MFS family [Myxococcus fulvus]